MHKQPQATTSSTSKSADSREEVNRVAFLLDEVLPVLHELLERHPGVVIDVELVVYRPGFHGDKHNPGVELFPENLREAGGTGEICGQMSA